MMKGKGKTGPDYSYEEGHWSEGRRSIAGIDEAGRGPLAGPVVAAAVILPRRYSLEGLNDSKKLTAARREVLYAAIMENEDILKAVGIVESPEIDRINILRATHLAMKKAVEALALVPDICLIDGLPVKNFPYPQQAIVKGDSLSVSISAASILAKVTRDRIMKDYHRLYPEYGFDTNCGYGTKKHLEALLKYGPVPIHRRSYAPVAQTSLSLFSEQNG